MISAANLTDAVSTRSAQSIELPPPLTSSLLSQVPGVVHGITRRVSGLAAAGNMSYSGTRDRAAAWEVRRRWCGLLGVEPAQLVTAGQVHQNGVLRITAHQAGIGARPDSGLVGIGDALITTEPGPVLLSMHADCLPIFLVDPDLPAVAVIHAGWRGTVANVAGATVVALAAVGASPERLLAYLGPAIGVECYEVGDEVAAAWQAVAPEPQPDILRPTGERWRFSLALANASLLQAAGVPAAHIESSGVCTRCGGDDWFSHRGQGAATGRFGAMIGLRPVTAEVSSR